MNPIEVECMLSVASVDGSGTVDASTWLGWEMRTNNPRINMDKPQFYSWGRHLQGSQRAEDRVLDVLKALRAEIPEAQASPRWGHVGVCEGYEGSSNSHGLSVATSQDKWIQMAPYMAIEASKTKTYCDYMVLWLLEMHSTSHLTFASGSRVFSMKPNSFLS